MPRISNYTKRCARQNIVVSSGAIADVADRRGCRRGIRDGPTLRKTTIYLYLSRMSRMFGGMKAPSPRRCRRPGSSHPLPGGPSLESFLSATSATRPNCHCTSDGYLSRMLQNTSATGPRQTGVCPRRPALLRLRPRPADLHRDEVPQRRAGEGRREGCGHRLLQERPPARAASACGTSSTISSCGAATGPPSIPASNRAASIVASASMKASAQAPWIGRLRHWV